MPLLPHSAGYKRVVTARPDPGERTGLPLPKGWWPATSQRSMWDGGVTIAANFGKQGLPWQRLAVGSSKDEQFRFARAEFEVPVGLRR